MLFLTLEGHEGAGKSTQANMLSEALNEKGVKSIVIREPGSTPVGEEIRATLMKIREGEKIYPETELFLFQASRAQVVRNTIKPAVEAGTIVIADRFYDSTWVFQGWARGVNLLAVEFTNRLAAAGVKIDKTFLLKLPLAVSMERIKKRGGTDRFEKESIEFYEKVHNGYNEVAKVYKDRIQVIDADRPAKEIHAQLFAEVIKLLE